MSRKVTPEMGVFTDLLDAITSKNPKKEMDRIAKSHEGKPYYADLLEKIGTLLAAKEALQRPAS